MHFLLEGNTHRDGVRHIQEIRPGFELLLAQVHAKPGNGPKPAQLQVVFACNCHDPKAKTAGNRLIKNQRLALFYRMERQTRSLLAALFPWLKSGRK